MKHDILAIHFPATRSDFVFVAGVDQNVRCSLVDSRARKAAISPGKTSQQGTRSAFIQLLCVNTSLGCSCCLVGVSPLIAQTPTKQSSVLVKDLIVI